MQKHCYESCSNLGKLYVNELNLLLRNVSHRFSQSLLNIISKSEKLYMDIKLNGVFNYTFSKSNWEHALTFVVNFKVIENRHCSM